MFSPICNTFLRLILVFVCVFVAKMNYKVYNTNNNRFLNIWKGEDKYGSKLQQTLEIAY